MNPTHPYMERTTILSDSKGFSLQVFWLTLLWFPHLLPHLKYRQPFWIWSTARSRLMYIVLPPGDRIYWKILLFGDCAEACNKMDVKWLLLRSQDKINSFAPTASYNGVNDFLVWNLFNHLPHHLTFLSMFTLVDHLLAPSEKLQHYFTHTNKSRRFYFSQLLWLWNSLL